MPTFPDKRWLVQIINSVRIMAREEKVKPRRSFALKFLSTRLVLRRGYCWSLVSLALVATPAPYPKAKKAILTAEGTSAQKTTDVRTAMSKNKTAKGNGVLPFIPSLLSAEIPSANAPISVIFPKMVRSRSKPKGDLIRLLPPTIYHRD